MKPANDTSAQRKQIPPLAEWPNFTYGARFAPDAFVIDLRVDTTAYLTDAETEGPPIDTDRVSMDVYRYSEIELALVQAPQLFLAVPDVVAWASAHHLLAFTRDVQQAFYTMLNDGTKVEPVTKSISLPSAALSSKLKGLRPLAIYLWERPWLPDPFGPQPTKGYSGFEFPFDVDQDEELGAWVTAYESKIPQVKIGCSENNGRKTLWLVPFQPIEKGCSLTPPALFGLRPLSTAPQSRADVPVRQYVSGQSLWSPDTVISKRSVKDIDINLLAANFVEALDLFPSEPVTAARQGIAYQRAYHELTSLFNDTGYESMLVQSQWWLRVWLEQKPCRANTMAAVLVSELSGVVAPAGITLLVEAVNSKAGQLLKVSQGALNFRENNTYYIAACSADIADLAEHNALPIACNLRVTGAYNPFNGEGDILLYHPVTLPPAGGPLLKANIPILLQTLPSSVFILQQQALASGVDASADAATKLVESRMWDYQIAYDRQSAAQDTLIVQLDTGNTRQSLIQAPSSPNLFDTLVEFSEIYPQLRIDLTQNKVKPEAIESFEWLALNVCNAWMYRKQTAMMKQQASYRLAETEDEDGTLCVNIAGPQGAEAIQLLPRYEGYTAEKTGEGWKFRSDTSQQYLSFTDRNWHLRSLVFQKLDVLNIESARAGLALERNLLPVDGKTPNPDFAMRTAFTGPAAPAAPFLDVPDAIDISSFGETQAKCIEGFFTRLFGDRTGRSLRLTVSYVYEAIPGTGIPVTIPVLLLPKETYTVTLAKRVAATIGEWQQRQELQADGVFEFDVTVFGVLEHRGVLRVKASVPFVRTTE